MTQLGWTYDQFLDSTFYFYFSIVQQWLVINGAKQSDEPEIKEERQILAFDELPDGYW